MINFYCTAFVYNGYKKKQRTEYAGVILEVQFLTLKFLPTGEAVNFSLENIHENSLSEFQGL